MKLVKSGFFIKEQETGLDGIYKHIEWAGRHCYKSLDKITENSAKEFVQRMIRAGHLSVLEHGTVYLDFPNSARDFDAIGGYSVNKYSKLRVVAKDDERVHNYVTTNLRTLVENGWIDDLKYLCEPTEYHEKRHTVEFILPIGISREFCRHRSLSFSEMSTRYCNFSKDKFGKELTFIIPCNSNIEPVSYSHADDTQYKWLNLTMGERTFINALRDAERNYLQLTTTGGWKAQQARDVLPLATKSELVMTGFASDWKHFFELRCDKAAHPQARELAIPLREEFIKRGYIKD